MYVSGGTNAMWQHSGSVVPICKYQGMYVSEALHIGGRFENILKFIEFMLVETKGSF